MDREDGERLARMEAHLEAVREGIKEIKDAIKAHIADDSEVHASVDKKQNALVKQVVTLKTRQKLIWSALGAMLGHLGWSQLGSLFK